MAHRTHKIYYTGAPIGSVDTLATALSTPPRQLRSIASRIEKHYLVFLKNVKGKDRSLSEPYLALKIIQKRILFRILSNLKFPDYLHGGIKAADPRDFVSNASAHVKAEVAIMMDIKSFFPSISLELVEQTFQRLLCFPPDVSKLLAELVTLNGSLPQGAPTSSVISNLVLYEDEYKLVAALESQGLTYTRLIDDITISSPVPLSDQRIDKIIRRVARMITSYGFKVHPDKTKIRRRSDPDELMVVTGLWLNRGVPKLAVSKRAEIAHEVIELKRQASAFGTTSPDYHKSYSSISGKVALLQRLKHARSLRLRSILAGIVPTYDQRGVSTVAHLVEKFVRRNKDPDRIGYVRRFYELQNNVAIVKRTHMPTAKKLQKLLNTKRPTSTMRSFYE